MSCQRCSMYCGSRPRRRLAQGASRSVEPPSPMLWIPASVSLGDDVVALNEDLVYLEEGFGRNCRRVMRVIHFWAARRRRAGGRLRRRPAVRQGTAGIYGVAWEGPPIWNLVTFEGGGARVTGKPSQKKFPDFLEKFACFSRIRGSRRSKVS